MTGFGNVLLGRPMPTRSETPLHTAVATTVYPDGTQHVNPMTSHYATAAEAVEQMWRRQKEAGRKPRRVPGGLTWTHTYGDHAGETVTIVYTDVIGKPPVTNIAAEPMFLSEPGQSFDGQLALFGGAA